MTKKSFAARWGYRLSLLAAVIALLGILGFRFDVMPFRMALSGLAGGALVASAAAALSIIGLAVTASGRRAGRGIAIVGLVMGLLIAVPVFYYRHLGTTVPPIHDISTDLTDPPQFIVMARDRPPGLNTLDRTSPPDLAARQQAAYPEIKTLALPMPPDQLFDRAAATAHNMGWDIVLADKSTGHLEAIDTTPVMGFKDDIVIRLRPEAPYTLVDIRSVSRVGESDLGTNARRIRHFLALLQEPDLGS